MFKKYLFTVLVLISGISTAAIISRIKIWSDGEILTAADLNTEFNQVVNTINSLDNDNLTASANISPSKISSTIDGSGITRNGSTGALSVNPDGTTLEITGDTVNVKANGVGNSQIRQSAALSVIGNSTNATANVADITASVDGYVLRRSGTSLGFGFVDTANIAANAITTAKILDGAVTKAKLTALGQQVSGNIAFESTTSTSLVDLPGATITITTLGRPVQIALVPTFGQVFSRAFCNNTSAACTGTFRVLRDATLVTDSILAGTEDVQVSTPFLVYDYPAAGTYTYKVQWKVALAGSSLLVEDLNLVVFEL